jgi:hypothetical protein
MLPDLACRSVVRLAGWIVPQGIRSQWRARWISCLRNLWILIARGEFPRAESEQIGWFIAAVWGDALRLRCGGFDPRKSARSPAFLLAAAYSALLLIAACTRWFATTRALIAEGRDVFFPYALVVAFALTVSLIIAVRGRVPWRGHDWRYWSFLLLKSAALVGILSLLWIEGGFLLRRHLANETVRALGGGLLFAVAFLAAIGSAVVWCLSDQQRRCPVCLRRMTAPVRIGTWASVFEPVTTELLCDEGHGALCLQECEMGEPDRWMAISMTSAADYLRNVYVPAGPSK